MKRLVAFLEGGEKYKWLEEIFTANPVYKLTPSLEGDVFSLICIEEKPGNCAFPIIYLRPPLQKEDGIFLPSPFKVRALFDILGSLQESESKPWQIGPMLFLPNQRNLAVGGRVIYLTQTETNLLEALCKSPEGLSRDFLQKVVLGFHEKVESHSLETHFYRIKKKIALLDVPSPLVFEGGLYRLTVLV